MKIGIISDTHKNQVLLSKVVGWLSKQHVPFLYHLGDDYGDVLDLEDVFSEVIQVPGLYDKEYIGKHVNIRSFETILGLTILLVHSLEKDTTREDIERSDIILHGHTHKYEIKLDRNKLFINPGHLKAEKDKNMEPTFGLLNIMDRDISVEIYGLNFKPLQNMRLMRSESGLYKVG